MVRSTQKESRQRAPLWLVVLLVANFGLMSWNAKDAETGQPVVKAWMQSLFTPVQTATTGVGGAGVGFFRRLADLRQAQAENETLRQRVAEAENALREAQQARDENERLKKLLDFTKDLEYQSIPARVVARDPSVWFNTLIINRGSTSGIDLEMPDVTPEGTVERHRLCARLRQERAAGDALRLRVGDGQRRRLCGHHGAGSHLPTGTERRHRGRSGAGLR